MTLAVTRTPEQLRESVLDLAQHQQSAAQAGRDHDAAVYGKALAADLLALSLITGQSVNELREQLCATQPPRQGPLLRYLLAWF